MVGLSASAQLTDGTVYWLQDASTGEFISQGADWGTQATIQDVGGVGFQVVNVSEGVYKLKNIMWNKVNNADLGLRVTDGYCDQAASDVTLTASGVGYHVGIAGGNYLCNNQAENDYGVKKLGLSTNSSDATVWKFLTKTEYDAAIQAYKDKKAASFATSLGLTAASVSALEAILAENYITKDYTSSITNAALNAGNTSGWTATKPNQRNQAFGSESGTMAEAWNGCVVATQTVSGLPNGLYKVTFVGTFRPKGNTDSEKLTSEQTSSPAYVFANDAKEEFIHWIDVSAKANNRTGIKNNASAYTSSFYTYVTDGSLKLGVKQDTWYDGNMWCPFGYFTLTYYSDAVSDEDADAILSDAATLEGKKMNADVLSALTSAKSTFDGSRTIANYNALYTAITKANACVTAYAAAKEYFDKVKSILDNTNVYTAEAYATYYTNPKAKYEDNTLTTEEANAINFGSRVTGNMPAILLSTWSKAGTAALPNDIGFYINTWSVEGNTDGSEFLTPFYEYWTGDANSLAATTLVSTITGLNPSTTYSFTIRARVRQTNGKTKIAKGITMKVGEGTPVDISAGTIFKTGPFFIGNFSAVGETDAEGKLVTTITVAENSNISWLSFYNAKYTEGEDLSAYIADYEFALGNATEALNNAAYAAVTGKEKTDLTTAVSTYGTVDNTDKTALIEAKNALEKAFNEFVQAAPAYNAFAELNADVAAKLGVDMPTITSTTVASDLEAIIVKEFNAANAYAIDFTNKLGAWSATPNPNQKGESWDGTDTDTYYDSYNGETTMTQTVTLPAGDYALIFKCRASAGANVNVTDGTNTVRFAHKGNTGRGIATDGTPTFADGATYARSGAGQGWEYRVLTFTSDGSTPTKLTFNWNTKTNQWAGLDDITLKGDNTSESVEVTAAEYATYVSDFNLDFTDKTIKAYTAKANGSVVTLTQINKVAAGTPVVLYAEGGKTEDIPVFAGAADDATGNELVRGTGAAVETGTNPVNYILNNVSGIGFYKAAGQTVAKNRAFLRVAAAIEARLSIVFGDEATGISEMKVAANDKAVFNLQGQRVKNAQKGLFIQNGKKVIIK